MTAVKYHFDRWGSCVGYVDADGRYFDARGMLRGHVNERSRLYGEDGAYRGRFDIQGQFWDEHGIARGYLHGAAAMPMTGSSGAWECGGPAASLTTKSRRPLRPKGA